MIKAMSDLLSPKFITSVVANHGMPATTGQCSKARLIARPYLSKAVMPGYPLLKSERTKLVHIVKLMKVDYN